LNLIPETFAIGVSPGTTPILHHPYSSPVRNWLVPFVNIFPFRFRKPTYPGSASLSSLLYGISVRILGVQIIYFFLEARTL